MARRLTITNPLLYKNENLTLDADYSSGASITVVSNSNVATNDILVFEGYGYEKSEAKDVGSTSGDTTITVSAALKFSHPKGTPLFISEFDQIEISRDTGSGWATLETIDIQWDKFRTIYIDSTGTSDYSYKFRFKNSAASTYSEYSPTVSGGGFSKNQIGYLVDIVKRMLNDPDGKILTVKEIIDEINNSKDIIVGSRNNWYFFKKEDEGTITTTADTRKYNLDAISENIEYIQDVRFRDQSNSDDNLYPIKELSDLEYDQIVIDQDEDADDHVTHYRIVAPDSSSSSGYIEVDPAPENSDNGSFYIRHYEPDADYEDVADTTSVPIPVILTYLPIAKGLRLKGKNGLADDYEAKFYGPADRRKGYQPLTGIPLLEQMQVGKFKAIGQPKQLVRFRGQRAMERMYSSRGFDRDRIAENYFDYPRR